MGVVERLAAKIVGMPLERRPEGFMVLREALEEAAKEMKSEGRKLNEFVNHTLSAVETLVRNGGHGGAGEGVRELPHILGVGHAPWPVREG
jgi:hypothetical protein